MIKENVKRILDELPAGIEIVAAAKTRTADEIVEAIEAGITIIGENYIQETEAVYQAIGNKAGWHLIGHLQKNKVKKAVQIFDMIETVDFLELAKEIDRNCRSIGKVMDILIEVNSAGEQQKYGVLPKNVELLVKEISSLNNVKIKGLMTMGPFSDNPEDSRPYFSETKILFDKLKSLNLPGIEMKCLSMGMSSSYKVAIEEGANMVRIGTLIFGQRNNKL